MQTLIDTNNALQKEIKALKDTVATLKSKPIRRAQVEEKPKKKSMFTSIKGLINKESSTGLNPKQIAAIDKIQELLLKEAYQEVDFFFQQNKKMICGKPRKGEPEPTPYSLINDFGENVLFKAIAEGRPGLAAAWLAKHKFDYNVADRDGYTVLMVAALFNEIELVEKIVGEANKDAKIILFNKTALHLAAEQDNTEVCQLLLDAGCDPNVEDSEGRRAYEFAPGPATRKVIVDKMLEQDPKAEIKQMRVQQEPEEKKRSYSQDEDMRPLLAEHEELKAQLKRVKMQVSELKRKRTPRVNADNLKLVPRADLGDRVKQLHLLVTRGNDMDAIEEVEELLIADVKDDFDKDAPDDLGETALMKAARLGFDDMVALLLLYKCNTELRDESGHTALMKASHFGKKSCVVKLIAEGADLDSNSRKGKYTALMLAAERGHVEICELLVREGADHLMRNSDGKTAIDVASNEETRERLEQIMEENPVARATVQI